MQNYVFLTGETDPESRTPLGCGEILGCDCVRGFCFFDNQKAGAWTPWERGHFGLRFACKITFSCPGKLPRKVPPPPMAAPPAPEALQCRLSQGGTQCGGRSMGVCACDT